MSKKQVKVNVGEKMVQAIVDDADEDYEIIDEGDWIHEHKSQYQEVIVKNIPTGKFYSTTVMRSAYGSDFFYDFEPCLTEVVKKEVTTISWVPVMQEE